MKILAKFNLILIVLFGAGMYVVSRLAYSFLEQNARSEVLHQAQMMVESAGATREYTESEIEPLLVDHPRFSQEFLPQIIPFYAATQIFTRLRKDYPDYTYKEATLNPSNPRDRAVEWEVDLINYFRNHPGEKELMGERDTPTGRALYLAHAIKANDDCLGCHGSVDKVMPTMVTTYGNVNGYGWKPGEVVAAQIVSVPMAVPLKIADSAFRRLLIFLAVVFVTTIVAIDLALYAIVIRPVRGLSAMADRISRGDMNLQELPVKGSDEIAAVTRSFNRMYVSMAKAMKMLKG